MSQAVEDWYDSVYLPIIAVVDERDILRRFPKRSRADIYLWIMTHRELLAERQGRTISPLDSALDYVDELDRDRDPVDMIREAIRLPRRFMRRLLTNPEDDMPMSSLVVERTPNVEEPDPPAGDEETD